MQKKNVRTSKKNIAIVLLIIILNLGSSTVFSQIRFEISDGNRTDGSLLLTSEDSALIHFFDIKSVDQKFNYQNYNEVNFEYINSEDFYKVVSQHKYTWVFVQSSWCGACLPALKKYIKLTDSLKNEDIKIIVINQDLRIKKLQKKIFSEKYFYRSYVLDPKLYGTIEAEKQKKFINEISRNAILDGYNNSAVPHNLFFNSDGKMIYYSPVNDVSIKTLYENVIK